MKLIVTAGGSGTKLWPYSREAKPKQFQKVVGDKSLFSYTIDTLLKAYSPSDIYISLKQSHVPLATQQAPQIPLKNYIVEPNIAKNRGPAEGLAFLKMYTEHPDEPFMLVQSDCLRTPEEEFIKMIQSADELVRRDKKFITGGIKATYPVLGVDYMRLGSRVDTDNGLEIFKIDEFIGRSEDYMKTKDLVGNYHVVIHCNHTCWYPELILNAYKEWKPEWYDALMKIKEVIGSASEKSDIERIYSEMDKGPTEIVLKNIFSTGYAILLNFRWTDIGTWNSVLEFFSANGNTYADGNVLALDTGGSLIKCDSQDKLIAVAGVEDLIIVDTADALLIVPKKKLDKIKDIQEQLKDRNLEKYL